MTTSLTIAINNVSSYNILEDTFSLPDKIEENSTCAFTIDDVNGTLSFKKGQKVTVDDTLEGRLFTGEIQGIKRHRGPDDVGTHIYHEISCVDKTKVLDQKSSNKQYVSQYAGAIAVDQIKDEWMNGITANYAIDVDDTQADFAAGTLSGTIAANNVEDGNLELAPAGSTVTITENTTSKFSSGTLTNMSASNNSLGPSSTPAIKIQAVQSGIAIANTYTYVKIFSSGSIGIITGRYLAYDIWISSASPEAKIAVDIVFTDNTTLRDNSVNNNDGKNYDAQNKSPHPGTDLAGLATDQWYHRRFLLDTFNGKTISYITVAVEGDKPGTYTGYIKNIYEVDVNNNVINTFFNGTLNVNPPQQMQKQGYSSTSVTVVNTYDCSTANRVSPSYNIDPVKILKSSFLSYKTSLPTGCTFNLSYSIDGGNSYTLIATNNIALPNLLAGQSLSGKSIQFLQSFTQGAGADPTQKPTLTYMQAAFYPSYTASKSDINGEWTTNAQWSASGTSFSNTQATSNMVMPFGAVRNWDDGDFSSQTLFGGGATGPNNANSCWQFVDSKQFRIQAHQSTEARSRLDFVGSWQNFQAEFDVYIDNSSMKPGFVYRTTGWSNYDANYAYAVEIFGTTVALQRGSNSSQAATGTRTQVASATINLTSQAIHRVKVIANGSSHQIYIDDVLVINATDSTYTGSGNIGFRVSNGDASNGYISLFDNFGISPTSLGGSWTSQSISLSGAGTYGGSVIQWVDASTDPDQVNNIVQSSIDGGSSWQTLTNGGAIQNLTLGQSLSGVSVRFKITFSANASTVLPKMQSLTAYVLGGFSSSGTRISKALLLSNVGICGTTLVFWNAIQPTNTSITVATSLDGSSYTNVSNGGSISGLTQQPVPSIDSFSLLSAGNYSNTARTGGTATTGWIWDTDNSRLSVSSGINALLLYSSISTKDVDIIFDIDQADQAGVVWRQTDVSNFYELDIFDASSSAGTTNVMRLYKIVSNVKTQIDTDIAISLVRGQIVKRVRVVMIGTAISIYFDGVLVRSTTDSSLSSAGLVGFIEVSGIARFYNLRIQPIGDDLTNKKVYTRITLTSTDPTVTPQVTDFTTLVTNPDIQAGALIPTADYRITYKSDNINDLAKQSNYIWNIKPSGNFIFKERKTEPAPWVLTSPVAPINNDILSGMYVEDLADLYRNRQRLKGVKDQLNANQTLRGDSVSTSWSLQYSVVSVISMTLNGQAVTFGKKGIDSGKDFYYEVGSNSLAQNSSGTVLQKDVDTLYISYIGQFETDIMRDNTGQFPGTISQKDYIAQCGLSVPVIAVLSQASSTQSASGTSDDLDVSLCRRIALDINVTARSGTPSIQFFIERKSADGSYTILYSSSTVSTSTAQVSRSIGPRCSTKESLGSTVRLRWTVTGSGSFTFSASILGKVDAGLADIGVVEAIEDISGQNLTVAAAQTLGDSRLQKYGVIGRALHFETRRTGLAAGQYLNCFVPELGLNDTALLIASVDRKQDTVVDSDGVSMTQDYTFAVDAVEGSTLPSWQKAMNDATLV